MNLKFPASFYQTWVITGGVYMLAGRCPFCGGQGCPGGLGTAGIVGGGIAGVAHGVGALKKFVDKKKTEMDRNLEAEKADGRKDG